MATVSRLVPAPIPDVLEQIKALVPELRAAQPESDRLARPPEHIAQKLKEAGAYSLTIPEPFGGLQANMRTWMDVVTEISRGDGGVAWAVTLVNSCNWTLASFFPKPVVDEVFSKPGTLVAGVFSGRACKARPVEGGILVDKGMWFFNSGVYQADWDLLGVPTFDKDGAPAGPGIALVPMSDVRLLHDWDPSGIRGSGSTNVAMEDVFIPSERIVSLVALNEGSQPRPYPGALFRTAFSPAMVAILAFPVLGLGQHMLETFLETLPNRDIKLTSYTKQAEAPVVHFQLGEASVKLDTARLLLENACREMDERATAKDYMPRLDRARLTRDCAFADRLIWEAVDLLATSGGGSFSRKDNIMNRIWQDVKVGSMHPYISVASNFEGYGRMLAGIEPPLMLV